MNDSAHPRTLIVGAHFSEQSGSGNFLGRIFSSWPTDRVATVCGGNLPPDWRRCQRHYRTGDLEFRLKSPFNWLVPANVSGPVIPSSAVYNHLASVKMSPSRRLARYPWGMFLRFLGGGEILYRVDPSPQLIEWVRDFQPEVLYGICSNLNSVRFLLRMHQKLGIPLALHFMDDWPATIYRQNLTSRVLRLNYLHEFAKLVNLADVAIAICEEMAREYEKRYQRPTLSLPMPAELDAYQTIAHNQWTAGQPFRIRYGGRVGWAIRDCLTDIAQSVHALRQEGADVFFDIVTFQTEEVPAACCAFSGVTVQAPGPLADLPRVQAEADVLIVCYDFDPESFTQARYSMPSKLADCMASGTPVLVYGPAGLPVVEYARREGWGKVVDRRDPAALRAAVCELMASAALREQLGRKARRLAAEQHDAKIVSENFRIILQKAACRS